MYELYNGDCLENYDLLENQIDCIITDPPFGVEFSKGFDDSKENIEEHIDDWLNMMHKVLKENRHCYIFIPTKNAPIWLSKISEVFELNNILSVRNYTSSTYLKNNFQFNTQLIAYCSKGKAKPLNKVDFIKTSDSWLKDKRNKNPKEYTYSYPSFIPDIFANVKNSCHPCEKNYKLIEFLIKLSTEPNDIVFDPFCGSGSTGVACLNTDRYFIGIELDKDFFEIAKKRIEDVEKELIDEFKKDF